MYWHPLSLQSWKTTKLSCPSVCSFFYSCRVLSIIFPCPVFSEWMGEECYSIRITVYWTSVCYSLSPQHPCIILWGHSCTPIWLSCRDSYFIYISCDPTACAWWSDWISV